jgi:hypothetical protein
MRTFIAKITLLGIITLGFAFSTPAWDEVGHKITAYIAWQRMTPATRERVINILLAAPEDAQLSTFYASYGARTLESRQREFFMLVSTWPDIIRDRKFETRSKKYANSNWHYSDTFWKAVDGKVELLPKPGEGGLAVEKLIEFDKLVHDPSIPDAQKAIAIAWLEHLIGDIHQPLHASGRVTDLEPKGDAGANTFLLTPKDTPREKQENLHWFWDSMIQRNLPNTGDLCDADYIDPIAKKIMEKYPFEKMQARLDLAKFEDWKKESFEIASTKVFPADLKRFEMPSEKYKKDALKIAEERMALAGYRMGELFNQIFGAPK